MEEAENGVEVHSLDGSKVGRVELADRSTDPEDPSRDDDDVEAAESFDHFVEGGCLGSRVGDVDGESEPGGVVEGGLD